MLSFNYTEHNDTEHSDIKHNDTEHSDIKLNDTQHNDAQLNDTSIKTFIVSVECRYA